MNPLGCRAAQELILVREGEGGHLPTGKTSLLPVEREEDSEGDWANAVLNGRSHSVTL